MNADRDLEVVAGNTVRLEVTFNDFSGVSTDQDLVKLKIYDNRYRSIEEFVMGSANKGTNNGEYFFDYLTSSNVGTFYYEWYGEKGTVKSVDRGKIETVFIK